MEGDQEKDALENKDRTKEEGEIHTKLDARVEAEYVATGGKAVGAEIHRVDGLVTVEAEKVELWWTHKTGHDFGFA